MSQLDQRDRIFNKKNHLLAELPGCGGAGVDDHKIRLRHIKAHRAGRRREQYTSDPII